MTRATKPSSVECKKIAASLSGFSSAVTALAQESPERMSMPQLLFFLMAAEADLRGVPTTFSAVREALGESVARSVNTTYKVMLEPTKQSPNGIGWMWRESDSDDERVKYFRLTNKGLAAVQAVAACLDTEKAKG